MTFRVATKKKKTVSAQEEMWDLLQSFINVSWQLYHNKKEILFCHVEFLTLISEPLHSASFSLT